MADEQAPEGAEPGDAPLRDPALSIATQESSVLVRTLDAIGTIGLINVMPRAASSARNGSLSYSRSAIRRAGFCRGRLGPDRGTAMVLSVAWPSVISAWDAEVTRTTRGRRWRSITTVSF